MKARNGDLPEYPEEVEANGRVERTWTFEMRLHPAEADFGAVSDALTRAVDWARRSAYAGKDFAVLDALQPRVVLSREKTGYVVVVSYDPRGIIGDCEMFALWIPLRVLNVIWRIEKLQGVAADAWLPLRARHPDDAQR